MVYTVCHSRIPTPSYSVSLRICSLQYARDSEVHPQKKGSSITFDESAHDPRLVVVEKGGMVGGGGALWMMSTLHFDGDTRLELNAILVLARRGLVVSCLGNRRGPAQLAQISGRSLEGN